jgi:hypothetical protein
VEPTTQEEVEQFIAACEGNGGEWVMSARRKTCAVYVCKKGLTGGDTVRIRVDCTPSFGNIPPDVVWETITDARHFAKWDDHCREYRTLARIDERTEVTYYSVRMPAVLRDRDWVLRRSQVADPARGVWVVMSRSVAVPEAPPRKEFVRATSHLTGFMLRRPPDGAAGSVLVYLAHNSFAGDVPVKLVNWATKSLAASIVGKLQRAAASLCKTPVEPLSPAQAMLDPIPDDIPPEATTTATAAD